MSVSQNWSERAASKIMRESLNFSKSGRRHIKGTLPFEWEALNRSGSWENRKKLLRDEEKKFHFSFTSSLLTTSNRDDSRWQSLVLTYSCIWPSYTCWLSDFQMKWHIWDVYFAWMYLRQSRELANVSWWYNILTSWYFILRPDNIWIRRLGVSDVGNFGKLFQ